MLLGVKSDNEHIAKLMKEGDLNNDGTIDLKEFKRIMLRKMDKD